MIRLNYFRDRGAGRFIELRLRDGSALKLRGATGAPLKPLLKALVQSSLGPDEKEAEARLDLRPNFECLSH